MAKGVIYNFQGKQYTDVNAYAAAVQAAQDAVEQREKDLAAKSAGRTAGQLTVKARPKNETFDGQDADKKPIKVAGKGNVLVYGLQRMPMSLYPAQWPKLASTLPDIAAVILSHSANLEFRDESEKSATIAWAQSVVAAQPASE